MSLGLLLDELKSSRRFYRTVRHQRFQISLLGQMFFDQTWHQNLRTLLPFVHHFLWCIYLFIREKKKDILKDIFFLGQKLTWSPLRRSKRVTHTMAARMPAWCVSAPKMVHSISMLTTPNLFSLFKYSILSSSVKSQKAPSSRPCPVRFFLM